MRRRGLQITKREGIGRSYLPGRVTVILLTMLAMSALASCSLLDPYFHSNIKVPVVAKTEFKPPEPAPAPTECEQPYCSTDLDFPLASVTNPRLYVSKEARRLWVVQDKVLVRDYTVALGASPRGDKQHMGDGRTPEGDFFVCTKNRASAFYKSLGINYPAPRHAETGLYAGLINKSEYKSIIDANQCVKMPPSHTTLGGAIYIHGGGCYTDWTKGCVALTNRAIDELFQIVSVGTPVTILP